MSLVSAKMTREPNNNKRHEVSQAIAVEDRAAIAAIIRQSL
jgi:hypothetical protein